MGAMLSRFSLCSLSLLSRGGVLYECNPRRAFDRDAGGSGGSLPAKSHVGSDEVVVQYYQLEQVRSRILNPPYAVKDIRQLPVEPLVAVVAAEFFSASGSP